MMKRRRFFGRCWALAVGAMLPGWLGRGAGAGADELAEVARIVAKHVVVDEHGKVKLRNHCWTWASSRRNTATTSSTGRTEKLS